MTCAFHVACWKDDLVLLVEEYMPNNTSYYYSNQF